MIKKAKDGVYTVAVLFYYDAIELIRDLMKNSEITVEAVEIVPPEYNNYDKEYYVSLTGDMYVSAEPAYVDGRYLTTDANLTLIDGEAKYEIIKDLPDINCREIYIDSSI